MVTIDAYYGKWRRAVIHIENNEFSTNIYCDDGSGIKIQHRTGNPHSFVHSLVKSPRKED